MLIIRRRAGVLFLYVGVPIKLVLDLALPMTRMVLRPGIFLTGLRITPVMIHLFQQRLRLAILFSLATVAAVLNMWQLLQGTMRPLAVFIW